MKSRPRSVEREVARHLTDFFVSRGFSPVERIPVLGRTGPDITINEIGLVVDVKSRLEVPKSYFCEYPMYIGSLVAIPLYSLPAFEEIHVAHFGKTSVMVQRWFDHMEEWTKKHRPGGITALVLHRPKMPIGGAMLIISYHDLEAFRCRLQQSQSTNHL